MKLKLDENLPVSIAGLLGARGLDAETVDEEGLAGTPDPDLLRVAADEDRMIFTLDKGFGDLRAYPPGTNAGIVGFRLDDISAPAVTAAVLGLVDHYGLDDLRGTIAAVGSRLVRRLGSGRGARGGPPEAGCFPLELGDSLTGLAELQAHPLAFGQIGRPSGPIGALSLRLRSPLAWSSG